MTKIMPRSVGVHQQVHFIHGKKLYLLGRCYSCHRRVYRASWEELDHFLWRKKVYCRACHIQLEHGIKMPKYIPTKFDKFKLLKLDESKLKYQREAINAAKRKGKRDTTFGSTGLLRRDLCFCQNLTCPFKGKPFLKDTMHGLKRRSVVFTKMFFHSDSCREIFLKDQDPNMNFRKVDPKILPVQEEKQE